jgi:hypothetical protein
MKVIRMAIRNWFFWNNPQTPDEVRAAYFVNVIAAVGVAVLFLLLRYA